MKERLRNFSVKNGHGLNTIFSAIWSSHLLSSWTPTRFQWQRCVLLHLPSHFLSTGNPSTKLSLCCVVIISWTFIVLLLPDHSQENKTWQLLSEPSRARGRRLIGPPMSSLEQGTAGQHGGRGEEGRCGPPPPSHTGTSDMASETPRPTCSWG